MLASAKLSALPPYVHKSLLQAYCTGKFRQCLSLYASDSDREKVRPRILGFSKSLGLSFEEESLTKGRTCLFLSSSFMQGVSKIILNPSCHMAKRWTRLFRASCAFASGGEMKRKESGGTLPGNRLWGEEEEREDSLH